jgi:hypothetical protein
MNFGKDITKIVTVIIMLVQFPVYGKYFLNTTHTISLENPNPIVVEVEAKEPEVTPTPSDPVEAYIHEVFGDDAGVAVAVAKAESGFENDRENKSPVECSIGLFQINLAKDHCNGKWVHASKVPGETMDEKVEWLKDPYNNIDMAKRIFDASGFRPWSVFTNGWYETFL